MCKRLPNALAPEQGMFEASRHPCNAYSQRSDTALSTPKVSFMRTIRCPLIPLIIQFENIPIKIHGRIESNGEVQDTIEVVVPLCKFEVPCTLCNQTAPLAPKNTTRAEIEGQGPRSPEYELTSSALGQWKQGRARVRVSCVRVFPL